MPVTADRGEVLHLAGRLRLSPALAGGAPVLLAAGDASATRCGWEPFFRALSERGLAVSWEEGDPSVRIVPRAGAGAAPPSLRRALGAARRFLRAWRGEAV